MVESSGRTSVARRTRNRKAASCDSVDRDVLERISNSAMNNERFAAGAGCADGQGRKSAVAARR